MPQQTFNFDALKTWEHGVVPHSLDLAFKSAIQDCHDRPTVMKARKIIVEFSVIPTQADDRGSTFLRANLAYSIKPTFPVRGVSSPMAVGKDGNLTFNSDAPDNPDQKTLYNGDGDEDGDESGDE